MDFSYDYDTISADQYALFIYKHQEDQHPSVFHDRLFIGQLIGKGSLKNSYYISIHGVDTQDLFNEWMFSKNFYKHIPRLVTIRVDQLKGYHILSEEDVMLTVGFFWISYPYKRDAFIYNSIFK